MKALPARRILLLLVSTAIFGSGCYQYRVSTTKNDPSTTYVQKTVHSFFWGKLQKREKAVDVVAANCDSLRVNSLDEVLVVNNFGYALITVATLGIWSPMSVKWKCSKPCAREGEIR